MLARTLHAPILTTMSAVAIEDTMADVRKTDAAIIEELNAALKESKRIEEANIKFPSDSIPKAPFDIGIWDRCKVTISTIGWGLYLLITLLTATLGLYVLVTGLMETGGQFNESILDDFDACAFTAICLIALGLLAKAESKAKHPVTDKAKAEPKANPPVTKKAEAKKAPVVDKAKTEELPPGVFMIELGIGCRTRSDSKIGAFILKERAAYDEEIVAQVEIEGHIDSLKGLESTYENMAAKFRNTTEGMDNGEVRSSLVEMATKMEAELVETKRIRTEGEEIKTERLTNLSDGLASRALEFAMECKNERINTEDLYRRIVKAVLMAEWLKK